MSSRVRCAHADDAAGRTQSVVPTPLVRWLGLATMLLGGRGGVVRADCDVPRGARAERPSPAEGTAWIVAMAVLLIDVLVLKGSSPGGEIEYGIFRDQRT